MKLYYDHPAENWHESLPLGNGRIGAMVYGGTKKEILAMKIHSGQGILKRRRKNFLKDILKK